MSATAFIDAFTEVDVPRSSGAVSGRFRAGWCAARVLVGSVLVTRRCLAVVRVLGPACSGGSFWAFSVDFGHAQHNLRGRGVFGGGGTGGLGRVVQKK